MGGTQEVSQEIEDAVVDEEALVTTDAQEEVQEVPGEGVEEGDRALPPSPVALGGAPVLEGSSAGAPDASRPTCPRPPSPALRRPPGRASLHSLADPHTGGLMYKVRLDAATLALPGESPSSAIARLQSALGAVFSAAWHGYAALHPAPGRGRLGTRDPRLHPEETCRGFLTAWQRCGCDAYSLDRELGLRVDWARVRARFLR